MKKLLVLFLACAMVLSMCAGFVFAEEADDQAAADEAAPKFTRLVSEVIKTM